MPKRIQRKRTKGWRMPAGAVSVCRPGPWGNPNKVGQFKDYDAADAVRDFERWINRDLGVRSFENVYGKPPTMEAITAALRGKDLACFCPLDQPCHADVLLRIANR